MAQPGVPPLRAVRLRDPWGDEALDAVGPHPLQRVAGVLYAGAVLAIAVWASRVLAERWSLVLLLGFFLPLLCYAAGLACATQRVRPRHGTARLLPFLVLLAVAHALLGLTASVALATGRSLAPTSDLQEWGFVGALVGVLTGMVPGLALVFFARRAAWLLALGTGGLIWLTWWGA